MTEGTDISEALVVVGVEERTTAHLEMEFDSGTTFAGECRVLTLLVVDAQTMEKRLVDFIVPPTSGATEVIAGLLTDEQWEAVCNA